MAGKGKPGLLAHVRHLFADKGLDALWKWAEDGKGASGKAERFRVLERFAENQRDQELPKSDERDAWGKRRKTYAAKRDKYEKQAKENAERDEFSTALGAPHWGGSRDFFDALIYPLASQMNMGADYDDKEYGHAAGGDHDPGVTNAFAEDFPTFSGADFANAIGRKFGRSSNTGTFDFIYYKWRGFTWRIQILWAVEGHFNHVHIGVRRV